MKRRAVSMAAAAFALLAWASVALAGGGASVTTYGGKGGQVQAQVSSSKGGTLPFTGAQLALIVFAAALLVLLGFGLRRMTRHKA